MNSPQNWNRFSYVNSNPIRFNDPTGHKTNPPPDARDYDDCWHKTKDGKYFRDAFCNEYEFEEDHHITLIPKNKPLIPVQLQPGIFILMAGNTNNEEESEDNKSTSVIGKTPPFNLAKLKKILGNLIDEGVGVDMGRETRQALAKTGAAGAYVPRQGRPGVLMLPDNPSESEVIEELIHLGQDRNSGWTLFSQMAEDPNLRRSLEMEVQQKMLKIAELLNWPLK